jgi:hypothetical protein
LPEKAQEEFKPKLDLFFQNTPVQCQLRKASEVIRENNISKIDLLKLTLKKQNWMSCMALQQKIG